MITIIDYGMGNLRSVQKAIEYVGGHAEITSDLTKISHSSKILLPGVGAFCQAMDNLKTKNLVAVIKKKSQEVPFLGICLGMQLLMATSAEYGPVEGLGVIKGSVDFFRDAPGFDKTLSVPHMGWNTLKQVKPNPLCAGLPSEFQVYFVHSYFVNPLEDVTIGETTYGFPYCAALQKGNTFAVQFHPEKSGDIGLTMLKNFNAL